MTMPDREEWERYVHQGTPPQEAGQLRYAWEQNIHLNNIENTLHEVRQQLERIAKALESNNRLRVWSE